MSIKNIFVFIFINLFSFVLPVQTFAQGQILSINNSRDAVCYTNHRSDPAYIKALKKKYRGLSNLEPVVKALENQNYIEVLNYLWTEPDAEKRILFLEEKVEEGHPILMFELAFEYFLRCPTIEVYSDVAIPWLEIGEIRTRIDSLCTSDQSASAASDFLGYNYQSFMNAILFQKYSRKKVQEYIDTHTEEYTRLKFYLIKKYLKPLALDEKVPSPSWIFEHGMAAFTGKKNTIPQKKWPEIRKEKALEILNQLKKMSS